MLDTITLVTGGQFAILLMKMKGNIHLLTVFEVKFHLDIYGAFTGGVVGRVDC
jgi:hypothetical protein